MTIRPEVSNQEPLYSFKLNAEANNVSRVCIVNYNLRTISKYMERYSLTYKDPTTGTRHEVALDKLDTVSHSRYYSFSPEWKPVIDAFRKDAIAKRDKAHENYMKYDSILNKLDDLRLEELN